MEERNRVTTANWLVVLAGLWLIIAPGILGFANTAASNNDMTTGIVIGVLGLVRALMPARWSWIDGLNLLAGLWLIIAPFILGFTFTGQIWNSVILGIIVAGLSAWSMGRMLYGRQPHIRT
ncbi:SPW repeat protein [Candidatus Daviesbacteria bacterium]|nr:SPW repeat protein [Candidatus Daviesbacteria bacterium]